MSSLTDKVSYIKGLAEGMKLNTETTEGKILTKVLELLGDVADEMAQMRKDHDELDEYVESIDNDLSDMEETLFGDEEDDEEGGCSCCHHHGEDEEDDEDEDEEDDDREVEYTCPHCGAEMTFEVDNFDFDEDYLCPTCHQPLFPETPTDEE